MEISVYAPIALISCLPVLLILMPIAYKRISPGSSFKISSIMIMISWCLISIVMMKIESNFTGWQWLAGMLLINSVIIFAFMLWSVFCWGYTISMLLCLPSDKAAVNLHQWENFYTGSDGIRKLTANRTQLLVRMRCVSINGEEVVLTKFGNLLAIVLEKACLYIGIKT